MLQFDLIAPFWDIYFYPWRPNTYTCDIFSKYHNIGDKTLILGSTPEFREMFLGQKVFIADSSLCMYENLGVGNDYEVYIQKNWLEMVKSEYNLVMGDLIFNLFPLKDQIILLDRIVGNLAEKGKFIFRAVVKRDDPKNRIVKHGGTLLDNLGKFNSDKAKFNYLTYELVNGLHYTSNDVLSFLLTNNHSFSKVYKEKYENMTPYGSETSFVFQEKFFEKVLKKYKLSLLMTTDHIVVRDNIYMIEKP